MEDLVGWAQRGSRKKGGIVTEGISGVQEGMGRLSQDGARLVGRVFIDEGPGEEGGGIVALCLC